MSKKLLIILILGLFIGTLIPNFSNAQFGLEYGEKIQGLSKEAPENFVGQIIKAVLLIIGVILIVLLIYGGFLYMTSHGNEKQIESAKNVLTYAIIGIVIIALAYAITIFILDALFPKEQEKQQQKQQLAASCTCNNGQQPSASTKTACDTACANNQGTKKFVEPTTTSINGTCTCDDYSKVSAANGKECYMNCLDKGGPKGFFDKYGYEYIYKPLRPDQTCVAENDSKRDCRAKPSITIEEETIKGTDFKLIADCCEGLTCNEKTGLCYEACAKAGEEYIIEELDIKTGLLKQSVISCCQDQGLIKNPNQANPICVRPKL